jgi:hypothetical protein
LSEATRAPARLSLSIVTKTRPTKWRVEHTGQAPEFRSLRAQLTEAEAALAHIKKDFDFMRKNLAAARWEDLGGSS